MYVEWVLLALIALHFTFLLLYDWIPRETINQDTTLCLIYITVLLTIAESVPRELGWVTVFLVDTPHFQYTENEPG